MTPLATLSNCSNPYAHEDLTASDIPALADELRRILLPRSWVNRALRDPPHTLTGVRRSCSPRVETRHRWRPHRTGSVGRRGRPAPRWGIYVTCFRSAVAPLRTADARRYGRLASSPRWWWRATPPARAPCPGRSRGTAACPGR